MEKFIVYKTTNNINKKIYIGVHKSRKSSFDGYLGNGMEKYTTTSHFYKPTTHFHRAVVKYGKENFVRETLYSFSTAEEAYQKEAEIVNEDFLRRKDVYNIGLGGDMKTGPRKRVYQFTLDGLLIKSWPGVVSVLKSLNLSHSYTQLYSHLKGKYEWRSYFWSYTKNINIEDFSFRRVSPGVKIKIKQLTIEGTIVKVWDSVTDLRKAGFSNVSGVLKGIRNKCKGYCFEYYEEDEDIVSSALKNAAVGGVPTSRV